MAAESKPDPGPRPSPDEAPTHGADAVVYVTETLPALRLAALVSSATYELAVDLGQRFGRAGRY